VLTPEIEGKKSKSMGNGHITIEFAEVGGKKVYIVVFRNEIGKTLYQGSLST
jgi:hypothetical protein